MSGGWTWTMCICVCVCVSVFFMYASNEDQSLEYQHSKQPKTNSRNFSYFSLDRKSTPRRKG